ncbi:hypothetical protein AB0M29_38045 [Streptomyces sp. NPDC051976]|uniref:hypothetical protein n=1 Tax=Streptomyces sp. NPDC051976 TaxID=3154947 RepID=UPI0034223A2A
MNRANRLEQHGPLGPVWFRIDGHHREDGAPLLQALEDVRTEAEFDQRQKQRRRAAEAEEQRREAEEKRQQDEGWAREEWFEKRERRMERLTGLWDEAGTADSVEPDSVRVVDAALVRPCLQPQLAAAPVEVEPYVRAAVAVVGPRSVSVWCRAGSGCPAGNAPYRAVPDVVAAGE